MDHVRCYDQMLKDGFQDKQGRMARSEGARWTVPDIDLGELRLLNDLRLSTPHEIRLPLPWIAVQSGHVRASLAAMTGV